MLEHDMRVMAMTGKAGKAMNYSLTDFHCALYLHPCSGNLQVSV